MKNKETALVIRRELVGVDGILDKGSPARCACPCWYATHVLSIAWAYDLDYEVNGLSDLNFFHDKRFPNVNESLYGSGTHDSPELRVPQSLI